MRSVRNVFTIAARPGRNLIWIVLSVLLAGGLAHAQSPTATNSDTEAIRKEMQDMQRDYDQRMNALEKHLEQVEAVNGVSNRPAATASGAATNEAPTSEQKADAFVTEQFQENTDSIGWALSQETNGPVQAQLEKVLNDFVDIGGYFRAGYGRDDKGGPQPAFQAPGAFAKYRLGNEAENYGELIIGKNWYTPGLFGLGTNGRPDGTPTGPIARAQIRLAFYDPYSDTGSGSAFRTSLPEAWAEVGNIMASQPSLKFWGGERFYRRQDIHINDFFFYNMSGAGGGFEDLALPFGKAALAWIGNGAQSGVYQSDIVALPAPNNQAGFSKQNFLLNVYDVPVPLGTAEFGIAGAMQSSGKDALGNQAANSSGVAVTFIHTHEHFVSEDGINKFSLQYGTGSAKTFTSGFETTVISNNTFIVPDEPSSWRFRATENFIAQPCDHFSVSPVVVYQYTDYHNTQGIVQWFSGGVRPIYHFDEHFSLAFEGGADYVYNEGQGDTGTLYKFTLAPQVSMGGRFMSRPVIRAFVTYAVWPSSFKGQVGGNDYADSTSGWTGGIQMECWW